MAGLEYLSEQEEALLSYHPEGIEGAVFSDKDKLFTPYRPKLDIDEKKDYRAPELNIEEHVQDELFSVIATSSKFTTSYLTQETGISRHRSLKFVEILRTNKLVEKFDKPETSGGRPSAIYTKSKFFDLYVQCSPRLKRAIVARELLKISD